MKQESFTPRFAALLVLIVVAGAMRIPNAAQVTPWANFSPVGAMALFGGAYLRPWWKAILFPLTTLLIGDLAISYWIFAGKYGVLYGGWYWIYGIFIMLVLLGRLLLRHVTVRNVIMSSVLACILHWLLSDLMVWIGGGTDLRTMQPLSRDVDGLIQCYMQGFPFMRNFLFGTLVYAGILFGGFEWMKIRLPQLRQGRA
ncbi:MAG: DUF6580 family putative transport protein [Chitinophagaceae bacterium]